MLHNVFIEQQVEAAEKKLIFNFDGVHNGKALKQINISGSNNGTVNIDAASLPAGTYNYALYAGGKMIGARQMILVK